MKKLSLLLAASLMALIWSCSLMEDTDMDSVDWGPVEENTFVGKDNEKEIANGDLILYIRSAPLRTNLYQLSFITSSDNYYIQFRFLGEPLPFPINDKGVLSFNHYITEGRCYIISKENGPFAVAALEGITQPCKILINCDVKQSGGYQELESENYGDIMKGSVQLKIVTMGGEKYQFSFKGLVPFLDTSEPLSTGSPYE